MSSGFYSAVSGAVARMHGLEVTSNNLANVGTAGFKKSNAFFSTTLQEAIQLRQGKGLNFTALRGVVPDFTEGSTIETGNPLNLAILGDGFFQIEGEDGTFYTRQGNFTLDKDGNLVTPTNHKVLGGGSPIVLDEPNVSIEPDGRIVGINGEIGRITVYAFEDNDRLQRVSDGIFSAPEGVEARELADPTLAQGRLEGSNVNMMQEMALMMTGVRLFESYQKIIKTYSELSAKANQIGLLG